MPAPALPAVFAHLTHQKNAAVDDALLEALPEMEDELRSAALQIILRRSRQPVLAELVRRFDDWPGTVRRMLVTGTAQISEAVRRAMASDSLPARLGAVETIRYGRLGSVAYLLADALKGDCVRTRQAAGKALAELARDVLEGSAAQTHDAEGAEGGTREPAPATPRPGAAPVDGAAIQAAGDGPGARQASDPGLDEKERQARARHASHVALALADAVNSWDRHARLEVLHAALWLADRIEPTLKARIEAPRSKFAHAAADAIAAANDPRLAAFTLRALKFESLATSAASAIEHGQREVFVRALLGHSDLLDDPGIARGLKKVRQPAWLKGGMDPVLQLVPDLQVRAVRFIAALGVPRAVKHEWYRDLLAVAADPVCQAVLQQLSLEPGDAAADLLARAARRGGDPAGEARPAAPVKSIESPPAGRPAVGAAAPAGQRTVAPAWNAFWDSFDGADAEERQRQIDALPQAVPDLVLLIRRKLAGAQPRDRLRALRIAGQAGVTRELAEDIYRLAHDADAMVRSTAMALLTALPGATGRRILREALNDPDDRVQANAIEALEALQDEQRDRVILPKLEAPAPRVRANAIKAMLRLEVREAGEALLRMLEDTSPAARLSALWVVERLELRSLTQRLVEMSLGDPDEKIRRRARRIVLGISPQARRVQDD